jgi:hypothetical protein
VSSTRVKDRRGVHVDFYATPARVVDGLLSVLTIDATRAALEPSAGDGAIVRRLRVAHPGLNVTGVEIQPQFEPALLTMCDRVVIGDFLSAPLFGLRYDLIVANPPYSLAREFIERSLSLLTDGGQAAFLLRLPFVAGVKRHDLFAKHRPARVLVLSQRPKFGGTNIDSCDYAWIVWRSTPATTTELDWLAPVPS